MTGGGNHLRGRLFELLIDRSPIPDLLGISLLPSSFLSASRPAVALYL